MESKNPLLSKTIWINLIVALAAFVPAVQGWMQEHPQVLIQALAGIGIVLRFLTKGKLELS